MSEFKWEPGWEDDDAEKPAPLGELSFEQECALITPEALLSLQAELLCDPCGIPLVDTGQRPPNEDGATHVEREVHAATRVRRLLAVCRDEKWQRLKTSPCREAIAKTPLPQIAKLALDLMRSRSLPLSEAVDAAVTHIEAEDYVRVEEASGYMDGIDKFERAKQEHKNHLEQAGKLLKWEWQRDEHGKPLPVGFEAGHKALFPLPGWKGARRKDEQLRRFRDFLIGIVRDEHPTVVAAEEERERLEEERLKLLKGRLIKVGQRVSEENGSKSLSEQEKWRLVSEAEREQIRAEAERRLREMKCDGIPPHLFRVAILWVDELHKERVSAMRSKASRASWTARGK